MAVTSGITEKAVDYVKQGYRAIKLRLSGSREEIAAIVAAVRARVEPDVALMVDVHTTFSVPAAIELGRRQEALGILWLESPTAPEDIRGQAEIARALDMAVAIGEWTRTRFEMRKVMERRAYDIAMPDIGRTGLTEGKTIASLANTYNIPVAPHVGGGGILSIAATVQFSASIPNFLIMEHSPDTYATRCQIVKAPLPLADGAFLVRNSPGLGVEVDEEAQARLAVR